MSEQFEVQIFYLLFQTLPKIKCVFFTNGVLLTLLLIFIATLCLGFNQMKSNPSEKEQKEAQSQLTKSDEIQRLVAQAHSSFSSQDYVTAAAHLDTIIDVRPPALSAVLLLCASLVKVKVYFVRC